MYGSHQVYGRWKQSVSRQNSGLSRQDPMFHSVRVALDVRCVYLVLSLLLARG